MNIIYGTTSETKHDELNDYFGRTLDFRLVSLKDIKPVTEIAETGNSFKENSILKAQAFKTHCEANGLTGMLVLADDTGLEIDAVNGKLVVITTSYFGKNLPQIGYINKLLYLLMREDVNRSATLVCSLTAILPDGITQTFEGKLRGRIAKQCGNLDGRVFYPVFIPDGETKALSELKGIDTPRIIAFKKLLEVIEIQKNTEEKIKRMNLNI